MSLESLLLKEIRLDGDTQPRVEMSKAIVEEYAQEMAEGACFPPVDVIYDGTNYWLYDGFHRYKAARELGRERIAAEVKEGKREDAVWESLAANRSHGLRRSNVDKQNAVRKALHLYRHMGDPLIAEHVGVSDRMVAKYRSELSTGAKLSPLKPRLGTDGKWYTPAGPKPTMGVRLATGAKLSPLRPRVGPDGVWQKPRLRPIIAPNRRPTREERLFGTMIAAPARPDRDALGRMFFGDHKERLHKVFAYRPDLVEAINRLMDVGRVISELAAKQNPVYRHLNLQEFRGTLKRAVTLLMQVCPHSMCPSCEGAGCVRCGGRGWVDDWSWRINRPRGVPVALPTRQSMLPARPAAEGRTPPQAPAPAAPRNEGHVPGVAQPPSAVPCQSDGPPSGCTAEGGCAT